MTSAAQKQEPTSAQAGRAYRQTDENGDTAWYCDYTGAKIGSYPGRYGYYCPGHHVVFQRIVPVRKPH